MTDTTPTDDAGTDPRTDGGSRAPVTDGSGRAGADGGADAAGDAGDDAATTDGDHDPAPGPTPLAADAVRDIEYAVPEGETPAARCERCGRPFTGERALRLHRGEVHDDLAPEETAAYERAREQERDELFFFHLRAVIVLGVLYAISVVLYMVVLGNNWI